MVTSLTALILALDRPTPFHYVFCVLRRFQVLHGHFKLRSLMVFHLGSALLAGATVAMLPQWHGNRWLLAAFATLPLAALLVAMPWLERGGSPIARSTVMASGAVTLLLMVYSPVRITLVRRLIPILLFAILFVDPTVWLLLSERSTHNLLSS